MTDGAARSKRRCRLLIHEDTELRCALGAVVDAFEAASSPLRVDCISPKYVPHEEEECKTPLKRMSQLFYIPLQIVSESQKTDTFLLLGSFFTLSVRLIHAFKNVRNSAVFGRINT